MPGALSPSSTTDMMSLLCSPGVSMTCPTQVCGGKKDNLTEEGSVVKASAELDASPQGIFTRAVL